MKLLFCTLAAIICTVQCLNELEEPSDGGLDLDLEPDYNDDGGGGTNSTANVNSNKTFFCSTNKTNEQYPRSNTLQLWPGGIVYFKFNSSVDAAHQNFTLSVMAYLQSVTCLKFIMAPASQTVGYVLITNNLGCTSTVGYHKNAVMKLNLQNTTVGTGCNTMGKEIHEFTHTLGCKHTHSSPIRDECFAINWSNIQNEYLDVFIKRNESDLCDICRNKIDYSGNMMYQLKAFAINSSIQTIIPLRPNDPGLELCGQRSYLNDEDIRVLNCLYNCPPKSINSTTPATVTTTTTKAPSTCTAKYPAWICELFGLT